MSSEGSEPVGSPVKVVKVCFAYVVKPFTGEVVKVCSGPKLRVRAARASHPTKSELTCNALISMLYMPYMLWLRIRPRERLSYCKL